MNRVLDLFLNILVFFLVAPLLILIGLVIFIFGGGLPIIFKQKRVGKSGSLFTLYKFRTMIQGADEMQQGYSNLNEANGPVFKIKNDPRFTKIGKFLSHTGLDELPQIINILRGEMSLVGPRPLPVGESDKLEKWQKKREKVLPGIISPWLFNGYHDSCFDKWMKLDLKYIENKSFIYDLSLIAGGLKLFWRLLKKEFADI